MSYLLVINAHPKADIQKSNSLQVAEHFLNRIKSVNPFLRFETVDLFDGAIPVVDDVVLRAWSKQAANQELDQREQAVAASMKELLQQFKRAAHYVIVMPLYNFNIPSRLKDYLDNVLIARETFAYSEHGPIGLLNDGRKMVVIQASDGIYSNPGWYADAEFSNKYMHFISRFVGIEDYTIIRAEGGAFLDKQAILDKAFLQADEVAQTFAASTAHA